MKRTNIHLTEQQLEELRDLARRTGLKLSEHIRRAIDQYLERETKRSKNDHLGGSEQ